MNLTDSPEEAAFLAAVNNSPNDDLPRLIYADWLEEAGFAQRAEEIRLQIALAEAKPWDAISIQHLRYDVGSFRRGFPYRMTVYDIPTLIRTLRSNTVPIGAIDVGTCPLNHWEDLVAMPEFQRIEEVRFTGLTLPIEPLRALRDAPNACNIRSLVFNRSNSLAFPEMIRELYLHPLGPQLKKLDIRFGQSGNEEDLFEAMTEHGQPIALEELRYDGPLRLFTMRQRDGFLKVVRQVKRLELPGSDLAGGGLGLILKNRTQPLQYFNICGSLVSDSDGINLFEREEVSTICWLDLCRVNQISSNVLPLQNRETHTLKTRVLRFTQIWDLLRYLEAGQEPGWTWLDLSENTNPEPTFVADTLLQSKSCNSLVRLTLNNLCISSLQEYERLQTHFGHRLELLDRPTGGIEV